MDIPLIAKKMLEEYKVSSLSDEEKRAWENEFISLLDRGGLSLLDNEVTPLEKDFDKYKKESRILALEAQNFLSTGLKGLDEDTKYILIIRVAHGTLGGKEISYKWRGSEGKELRELSDKDRELLEGLNEVERELCINTSAEIASLNAKKSRLEDVLKIAERIKENFVPGGTESRDKDESLAEDTAKQFKANSKNPKSPYTVEVITFVMQFALDHPDEKNVAELVRNIREHADCPIILKEKGLEDTTKPERNWIKKIDKAAGFERY